jgi:hypothetical protein
MRVVRQYALSKVLLHVVDGTDDHGVDALSRERLCDPSLCITKSCK